MPTTTPVRNLDAVILGTGEFSFSLGATGVADARSKGYVDFGNITAIGLKPSMEKVEHEGSYRGIKRVDKTYATKTNLEYQIKCDEWDQQKLMLALMGEAGTAFTQSELTYVTGETWAFNTTAAVAGSWYDVRYNSVQVREITEISIPSVSSGVAAVAEADDETFTDAAHGLANGQALYLTATAMPTGLTTLKKYYVVNKTDNTFQVSTTVGGSAAAFSTDGTDVLYWPCYAEDTDYWVDYKVGRVRFAATKSAATIPIVSASAITSADAGYMRAVTPMQEAIQSGYGRLMLFDDTHDNDLVYLHDGFSCEVSLESAGDFDGKNIVEMTLTVKVTDTVGTVYSAE